jgi:hypothetical protein
MEPKCPNCGTRLEAVRYPANCVLNADQWSSIRAGDYYCPICPGTRGNSGKRYYWAQEVQEPTHV